MVAIYEVNRFSLQDFPQRTSCIVFTAGCDLRCTFCHNPAVVNAGHPKWNEQKLFEFLGSRRGKLDGVVITGGEPCIHSDLHLLIQRIRFEHGFAVKLDTNGTYPDRLRDLLKRRLVDYVAMDVKAPFSRFNMITRSKGYISRVRQSMKILINSGVDHEFRTTVIPELSPDDLVEMYGYIRKGRRYILQPYAEGSTLDPQKHLQTYSQEQLERMASHLRQSVKDGCEILVR